MPTGATPTGALAMRAWTRPATMVDASNPPAYDRLRRGFRATCGPPLALHTVIRGPAVHIYVDADGCPVKHGTFRVADRHGVRMTLAAGSWMRIPSQPKS